MLPSNSGCNVFTAQVHQVTAKLEQQVSSLTAALEGSKQREGLAAHKLSQREEQLQTVSKLLEVAIQDSLHEEHELQTELKQVHLLPSTLPLNPSRSLEVCPVCVQQYLCGHLNVFSPCYTLLCYQCITVQLS